MTRSTPGSGRATRASCRPAPGPRRSRSGRRGRSRTPSRRRASPGRDRRRGPDRLGSKLGDDPLRLSPTMHTVAALQAEPLSPSARSRTCGGYAAQVSRRPHRPPHAARSARLAPRVRQYELGSVESCVMTRRPGRPQLEFERLLTMPLILAEVGPDHLGIRPSGRDCPRRLAEIEHGHALEMSMTMPMSCSMSTTVTPAPR